MNYTKLDLRAIKETLGSHYRATQRDEYTGVCEQCEDDVPQSVDRCETCGVPVVWLNSPLWKQLYGSPEAAIRRLSVIPPGDNAGRLLCQRAGVAGFANQTESKRWDRCVKKLSQARLEGIVEYAAKGKRGRGIIAHALNLAEKIVREETAPPSAPKIISAPRWD